MSIIVETITVEIPNGTSLYAAGDVVGGLITIPTNSPRGIIEQVIVADDDGQNLADTIYLYDTAPTSIADNAAFAITAAERNTLVGAVGLAAFNAATDASYNDVSIPFALSGSTSYSIYAYLVSAAGGTYTAANAITLRVSIRR